MNRMPEPPLAAGTLGLPSTVAVWTWVRDEEKTDLCVVIHGSDGLNLDGIRAPVAAEFLGGPHRAGRKDRSMTELEIRLKRAYEEPCEGDGTRVLVDRIWPRGVSRQKARVDLWLREVAPSDGLRRWFGHEPERWEEFRERYWRELDEREEVEDLADLVRKGRVTLLFGARDEERNNAVALKEYLERRL